MIKKINSPKNKKRKYFGTDGIRGRANTYPMTGETALKVGMAAGEYFTRGKHKHNVVIGKDTRLSGYLIEPSLTAGFISMGMNVFLVGPMPTPAISMLTRSMRCDVGVMISASHNSYEDNGIKLFDPNGEKLSDKSELKIESLMDKNHKTNLVDSSKLGRAKRIEDAAGRYLEFVKSTFPDELSLKKLKIPYKIVSRFSGVSKISYDELLKNEDLINYKLIINTTPLGMYPNIDSIPNLNFDQLTSNHYVFDLVYNPEETKLLSTSKSKGSKIKNGYDMLVNQAELSWEIWNK